MESQDKQETWPCISTRNEEDVSKSMPIGEPYDNGVTMDWYSKDTTLSNESWKPIRDQILQDEHLVLAHALEILEAFCGHDAESRAAAYDDGVT